MNKKTFHVLDTSVLVDDPFCLSKFKNIQIPIDVLEELDKLKTFPGKVGQNARIAIKEIDKKKDSIVFDIKKNKNSLSDIPDNRILASALALQKTQKTAKIILVSKDFNLRLKAKVNNIEAQDYFEVSDVSDLYKGFREIKNDELNKILFETQFGPLPKELNDLNPNEYVLVSGAESAIALCRRAKNQLQMLPMNKKIWGLDSKNKEQALAFDLLTNDKIPLVTLVGKAGCGKSLCALAAGLEAVLERKRFESLIVYRPIQPVGNDIGYLPGSYQEKVQPWMGPIMDNMEVLLGKNKNWQQTLEMYQDKGKVRFEAMTYIRGRSINNAFVVFDEIQNLDQEQVKTVLTRVGFNTKIVFTGDIEQIDRNDLDSLNNGLTHVIEKFKNESLAGHLTLMKGERSALATLASKKL